MDNGIMIAKFLANLQRGDVANGAESFNDLIRDRVMEKMEERAGAISHDMNQKLTAFSYDEE